MNSFINPLLEKADSLPFLFVGSGMSRRYLNLPTWEDLLKYISTLVYDDKFGFVSAQNQASKQFNKATQYNNYMTTLCDIISDDLDKIWYTSQKFKANREKYDELISKKHVPPIKIEITEYINSFSDYVPGFQHEIDALSEISTHYISGIITTNYDNLMENIFNYETYSSQEDLLFHSQYSIGETYKIHGCVSKPETIMITSSDYKQIDEKHKYLAAKLLTIFVEHPIFFLGYSISDEDILSILNDIQLCLSDSQLNEISDRLFYVVWDPEEEYFKESTSTITFPNGNSLTLRQITLSDYSLLYKALCQNKSKYPIKLLRHVKNDMYNMMLTNDPSNRMVLSLPNDELSEENIDKIEFVYGFGIMERAKNGYQLISKDEIYRDSIFNDGNFHPELFVNGTLKHALVSSGGFLPIRKYTSQLPVDSLPTPIKNNLDRFNSIKKILSHSLWKEKSQMRDVLSFSDALSGPDRNKKLAIVEYNKDNIEDLGDYLKRTLSVENFVTNTDIRRLIRIYDFIKYN